MVNIYEILQRAASLKEETALNSISPERAGGIMYDTLLALNDLWLQQGSALVISKIYASVAAMEADTAPVSDLTGKPLRPGQIVVIASSDSDNGSVYRYNGTDAPSWSLVGTIGNLTPVDSLDSDSTSLPLAAHQGKVLDGKISQLGQQVIYDVTKNNPTAGPNNDGKFESLSALLSDANLSMLIPIAIRCGGMSIRFVQTSDNKYVQYRCMADEFTTDTTQWAIAEEGVYVENPEYVYVKTDKEGKILWAIKTDGNIYYGAGVPQQVINYINERIDEYDDIVAFLNDYLGSDTTLKTLIDSKLDAEGLNPNGLSSIQTSDAPDFFDVTTDENGKVLEGITTEGTKQINIPLKLKDVSFENSNGDILNLNRINLSESGVDSLKDDLGLNAETHAVNTVSYLKYNNLNEQRGLFSMQMDLGYLDNNVSGYLNMVNVLREYGLMSMDFAINITALESPNINNLLVLQQEGCEIIYHNRVNTQSDFSANSTLTVEEAKTGVCAERLQMTRKGFTTFGVVANNGSMGDQYKPMIDDLFFWSEYGSKQPHQAYQNTKAQYLTDHRIIRTGFDITDENYQVEGYEQQIINYGKTWIDNLCTNKTFGVMYCHYFAGNADIYRLPESTLRPIAAYLKEKIESGELYYGSITECLNLLCK